MEINFLHPIGYFEPNCDKSFPNIYQYLTKEWVYEKCKICRKIFSAASIKSDLKTPSMINMGHKGCQGIRCQINRFNSVNLWNNSWRAMVRLVYRYYNLWFFCIHVPTSLPPDRDRTAFI